MTERQKDQTIGKKKIASVITMSEASTADKVRRQ
jgi:hypothetical protein